MQEHHWRVAGEEGEEEGRGKKKQKQKEVQGESRRLTEKKLGAEGDGRSALLVDCPLFFSQQRSRIHSKLTLQVQ